MTQGSRWDYFQRFLPYWLQGVRFRGYAYALGLAGIYFLFVMPLIAIPAFAGAAYFWFMSPFYTGVARSQRRLVEVF